jgi:hypothetical protein
MDNLRLIGNHPKLFGANNFVQKPIDNQKSIGSSLMIFDLKYHQVKNDE